MKCKYACQTADHQMARRSFLGLTAAGLGLSAFAQPAAAKQLSGADQRVLVIFLRGGLSQLESWDPKPYTENGGPFRPISTSVPGIQISELLPHTAQNMHRLSIVRSLNSKEADHGRGLYSMTTGRKKEAASEYPHLGAVTSRLLTSANSPMPGFIRVSAKGAGINTRDAAYLGAKYASMTLADGQTPPNSTRAATLTPDRDTARQQLRQRMSDRFATRRRTAETEAYTYSYDQAAQLMERADLFDVTREPLREQERYGKHDFGRHLLLARRLLENGVTFAEVSHSNYDTHYENFEYHIEQLGEFDRSFATLLQDLDERGMLDSTLVVVMSEMGRTPRINANYGRDHWGKAWSVALTGAKIQRGTVVGKTSDDGTAVVDREVSTGDLFHTYLSAVGIDSRDTIDVNGRPMPAADPAYGAIKELLG